MKDIIETFKEIWLIDKIEFISSILFMPILFTLMYLGLYIIQ
jgi:hypothetical protein